jgi:hypothetical protein
VTTKIGVLSLILSRNVAVFIKKIEERVGVGGRGKYRAPPHHLRKKEGRRRKKQLADRKVPDGPGVVKGEGY